MAQRHILLVPAWWPSPEQPLAGTFAVDYARAFMAAGAQVGVIFPDLIGPRSWGRADVRAIIPRVALRALDNIPIVRIRGLHTAFGRPWIQMRRYLRWLRAGYRRYAERFGTPDVIHAHCAIPAGWAALRLGASPVVITEHTGPFSLALTPPAAAGYTRAALGEAAAVVSVSPQHREQMVQAGIERPIEVIPNPVSRDFVWQPAPSSRSGEDGRAVFHVIFVGRLVAEKGVYELAGAIERLRDNSELDITWHIVGDGPEVRRLDERLRSAIEQRRVRFHGLCEKPRVAELLGQSYLFVLPSYGESGALAVAEALMTGRPAVGTTGTACESVIGPEDGLLCSPRDTDGLVDAIRAALRGYDRWDSRRIAERARARFAAEVIAARYFELFDRIITG